MLAITAWVWSCGSRLRLATWRNSRRRHERRLHPGTLPRLRVPAARLQKGLLHPVQRRPDRLVMRPHHRTVAPGMALRRQQRRQRYGLRRRKGQVESRTALVPAVPDPPQPDLRPRHMTLQQPSRTPATTPARPASDPAPPDRSRATRSPRGALPASREALPRRPSTRRNTPRRAGNTPGWPTTRSDCGSSLPSKRTITALEPASTPWNGAKSDRRAVIHRKLSRANPAARRGAVSTHKARG